MNARRTPKLRHHKATGQAYVVLNNKYIFFGRYGTSEATQKYHQVIAEWLAAGRQLSQPLDDITINEIIARFWEHAQGYYVRPGGTPTCEINNFRQALRPLQALYGGTRANEFGPRALVAVRQVMIQKEWCRNNINKMMGRIKLMFRWASEKELIAASVFHSLQTVRGLPKGRSEAKETAPVTPVPQEYIDAVEPYVSRQVWALIQLQLLTGKRQPGQHYTTSGYGHTITKAIKKAFRPEGMSNAEFKTWKPPQHWHPHQLRHNAATFLRKEFGLETARIILGHRSAVITELYAELDQQKALEAIVRVG